MTMHPIFIILNALNMPSPAIEHRLENANAVRNYVAYSLMDFYKNVEIVKGNMIICSDPIPEVTPYEKVFVRCLGNPYPKQVREFQEETRSVMMAKEPAVDDKRSLLQRFERILIATEMSESTKQLTWRCHIDYIYYNKATDNWTQRYTGYKREVKI